MTNEYFSRKREVANMATPARKSSSPPLRSAEAARCVIAGKDLNRNVKRTASKIAEEVAQKTKGT